jgi:hypothetical protein
MQAYHVVQSLCNLSLIVLRYYPINLFSNQRENNPCGCLFLTNEKYKTEPVKRITSNQYISKHAMSVRK